MNYIAYASEIIAYIAAAIAGIIVALLTFVIIQIVGLFISDFTITVYGRYDLSHDNVFKIILEQLVRAGFIIIWVALSIGMTVLNVYVGLAFFVFYPLVFCYIALFSAWLTTPKEVRPEYSSYVTFKNMLIMLGTNILQLLMSIAITVLIYFICGIIIAVVCGLALLVLAFANANLNAYAFLYNAPGYIVNKQENTQVQVQPQDGHQEQPAMQDQAQPEPQPQEQSVTSAQPDIDITSTIAMDKNEVPEIRFPETDGDK